MKEIDFIERVLQDAAAFVRREYARRSEVEVSSKADPTDLLTQVDLAVQDMIVNRIADTFPGDIVAAEERGLDRDPEDPACRCWILDPIDGTQNFVRGLFPTFGISLAFAVEGRAVAGGVSLPIATDLFLAERGAGAFRNGERLRVSEVDSLAVARIEVDFASPRERRETLDRAAELICEAGQIRCTSSTVVGMCSVASADMDAFVHVAMEPYDYAASQLIAEEAGGKATRLDGSPLLLFDGKRGAVVSNGLLHDALLAILRRRTETMLPSGI